MSYFVNDLLGTEFSRPAVYYNLEHISFGVGVHMWFSVKWKIITGC
jgi:hypothetical protein